MDAADCKTLWMGDIQMHWDETFISALFAAARTFARFIAPLNSNIRPHHACHAMPCCICLFVVCPWCAAEQPVVKLIRDKVTGYPAGYGFLEFSTQHGAQAVLDSFNGQLIRAFLLSCSREAMPMGLLLLLLL